MFSTACNLVENMSYTSELIKIALFNFQKLSILLTVVRNAE